MACHLWQVVENAEFLIFIDYLLVSEVHFTYVPYYTSQFLIISKF